MYCTQTTAILLSFIWMNVVLQPNYAEFALVTHVYDMYWIHHFFTPKLWTSIINHSVSCLQGLNWGVGIFYFLTHFHGISFYIHTEIHNKGDEPHYAENEDVCGKSSQISFLNSSFSNVLYAHQCVYVHRFNVMGLFYGRKNFDVWFIRWNMRVWHLSCYFCS